MQAILARLGVLSVKATSRDLRFFSARFNPLLNSHPQPGEPPIVGGLANLVGEFNADEINSQFSNQLNWLPETTYAAPPVVLRYDAQGHPITPTTLLPTTNQAGMLIQPPLALTTLRAATQLTGNDHLISVIRVRVSGVTAPNDASWKRVERVAQLIEQRTGLRALVTLGSSPAPTLVYVPGLQLGQDGSTRTIAPLGWVYAGGVATRPAFIPIKAQMQCRQNFVL